MRKAHSVILGVFFSSNYTYQKEKKVKCILAEKKKQMPRWLRKKSKIKISAQHPPPPQWLMFRPLKYDLMQLLLIASPPVVTCTTAVKNRRITKPHQGKARDLCDHCYARARHFGAKNGSHASLPFHGVFTPPESQKCLLCGIVH